MAKTVSVQEGGIVFGDWKLFPLDDRNWELCHKHTTADTTSARKSGTVGEVKWHRTGRFYQYNTFDLAIQYAADCVLKDAARERQMELVDALRYHRDTIDRLKDDVIDAIGATHD